MANTMKAVQIKEFNAPYTVSDVPKPSPAAHQVLIKIAAGGFCHTDLMALNNEFNSKLPFIGSHEPAGTIVEIGQNVRDFSIGDRVGAINFDTACGRCPDCDAGRTTYCDDLEGMKGITSDGAWAEYMVADSNFLVKIPDTVAFDVAASLMCAGLTIYGSIITANVAKGGTIGFMGIGGLGHIGTQLAKAMGYTVLAVDVKQDALDLANNALHKPDVSFLATDDTNRALDRLHQVNPNQHGYRGVDAMILATDQAESFRTAVMLTRKHGKLVLLGQPAKGITMRFQDVIFKDITLVGSLLGNVKQGNELMKLIAEWGIKVNIKKWKLQQAEEMRQEFLSGQSRGKNVIVLE